MERFTRVDADTLRYEFTIEDPTRWTRPWSGELPLRQTDGSLFEYACHEGNIQHRQHAERRTGGGADRPPGYVALVDILKLAWRNIGRNRRRTVVTVGAMAFGLFTMVVWFAIFQGMLLDMERTVVDVEIGDLQIHAPTYLDEPSLLYGHRRRRHADLHAGGGGVPGRARSSSAAGSLRPACRRRVRPCAA